MSLCQLHVCPMPCPLCELHTKTEVTFLTTAERYLQGLFIPDGWQLVPKEPTVAMIAAYRGALKEMIEGLPKEQRNHKKPIREPFKCLGRWRAMLRAAPTPPLTVPSTSMGVENDVP